MATPITSNFQLNINKPIDTRFSVNNIADRNNINFKYPGLNVYVITEDKFYYWDGSSWVDDLILPAFKGLLYQNNISTIGTSSGDNYNTGVICSLDITDNITLTINGLSYNLLNSKTDLAYFSLDSGVTATTNYLNSTLYWNSIISGYNLDPTDKLSLTGFGLE